MQAWAWLVMPGHAHPKTVPHMLSNLGEHLHAKKGRYWCIPSRDIDDQIILQSDWTRSFSPITLNQNFSLICGLHRKVGNFFHFKLLTAKSNENFLWKVRKPSFWVHLGPFFLILGQKRTFLENALLWIFSAFRFQ